VHRLETQAADAIRAADEPTYRAWRLFLSASAYGFERGPINVNQALLARPDHGRVNLPLTRAHLYPQA